MAWSAEVVYNGPLAAPIAKGRQVAELVIDVPGLPERRVPLLTASDVAQAGFLARMSDAARKLYAEYIAKSATAG